MTEKADRLRTARIKAGFSSAQEAAEAFGWGVAGYRHHENGTRGYSVEAARKYARAFRVKMAWLLGMEGYGEGPAQSPNVSPAKLIVAGSVAAGLWRERTEGAPMLEIDTPPHIAEVERFGLVVEGHSMNLCYQPGTILDCVSIHSIEVEPEPGDHVIVERIKVDGLRELTVKEVDKRDGRYFLVPRSDRPEYQREIEIGAPDVTADHGEVVQVIGFVVSIISPQALRLLERMGKVMRL